MQPLPYVSCESGMRIEEFEIRLALQAAYAEIKACYTG